MEMVFFILIIMLPFSFVYANNQGDDLYAFKKGLGDPTYVLQSWDPNLINPCTWFHVTCDTSNNVIRVDLGGAKLAGPLVANLGKLDKLQYLVLNDNSLTGFIPQELGNLKNLKSLELYNNKLSGRVPDSLKNIPNLQVHIWGNQGLCGPFTNKACP